MVNNKKVPELPGELSQLDATPSSRNSNEEISAYVPHYNRYTRDLASRSRLGRSNRFSTHWQQSCCCGRSGVIEPEKSKFLPRWDGVCGLGLIFICFVAPLEVAFLDNHFSWPLFIANRMVDMLFIVDLVLQFFIACPIKVRGNNSTMYAFKKKIIARRYLTSWFIIDFISIIPFDLLAVLAHSEDMSKLHLLKVVRLFRLLKLLRLLKGVRIFERWQMEFGISHRKLTLWRLVGSVVIASHWMSCALGLMSHLQGTPCRDGLPQGCIETWKSNALEMQVTGADASWRTPPGEAYLLSLYTAITIIVHPHAFLPTGPEENLLFVIVMLLGGFVWTRVISRSTAISTSLDRHKIHFKQTMDDVNAIADDLGLSVALRRQLRGFFMNTRDYSKTETWQELTRRMSPQLRRATAREVNWPWVQQIPYLRGCSWPMITAVAEGLETQRYAQHEIFGKPCHLYVLSRGLVSRCISLTKLLHPGAVWGEDHLLLYCSHLFEDVTSVAQCFTEVLAMSRKRFEEISQDNPENQELLRKHYVKISITRGVRYLASQARIKLSESRKKSTRTSEILEQLGVPRMRKGGSMRQLKIDTDKASSGNSTNELAAKETPVSSPLSRVVPTPLSPGPLLTGRKSVDAGVHDLGVAISALRSDMESLGTEFDLTLHAIRSSMDEKMSAVLWKAQQIANLSLPGPSNHTAQEEACNETLSRSALLEQLQAAQAKGDGKDEEKPDFAQGLDLAVQDTCADGSVPSTCADGSVPTSPKEEDALPLPGQLS